MASSNAAIAAGACVNPDGAIACLLLVVVSSALALVPQSTRLLGLEILIVVVPMLVITVRSQLTHRRQNRDDPLLWTLSRMAGTAAATVPCTVAGVSLAPARGRRVLLAGPGCAARNNRHGLQRLGSTGRNRPLIRLTAGWLTGAGAAGRASGGVTRPWRPS